MATKKNQLNEGVDIEFADGKSRRIRPLTIRQLRSFTKAIEKLDLETNTFDEGTIDQMVSAAQIALEKVDPELAADKDLLEDVLDIKNFNLLLAAAMGADPN